MFLKPLDKIGYFSYMEVPTVYSDALSYLEDISRLYQKLNEVISSYNVLIDYYNGLDDTISLLNQKIAEWEKELAELEAWQKQLEQEFAAEIAKLDGKFDSLEETLNQNLDNAIEQMNTNIQNILNQQIKIIEAQLEAFDKKIDNSNAEIKQFIQAKLDAFEQQIPTFQNVVVINPATGEVEALQDVIDQLYMNTSYDAMTAAEYDALGLTAAEYDSWYDTGHSTGEGVTAARYDAHGRTIFYKRIRSRRASSINGSPAHTTDLIRENNGFIRAPGALTAAEYDAMKITAGEYDALRIKAYDYDWKANRIIQKGEET